LTKVHRTFYPNAEGITVDQILILLDFEYLHPFKSKPSTSKSSKFAPHFACLASNLFWGRAPKFWTGIIKLNTIHHAVQLLSRS